MCIIVVKPADVSMPSDETLKACFENNSDGAGMMISHEGKVYGNKGLMTFRAFMDQLDRYKEIYGDLKSHTMVFHFRIGTHGTNTPENTHPFPLDDYGSYHSFKKTEWVADQGFAHNGVLYQFGAHADVKKYDVSDTMVFGRRVAAVLADSFNLATAPEAQFILDKISIGSSKFVYIDGDGNYATFGTFIPENGIFYSNGTYKSYRQKYVYDFDSYDSGTPWWNKNYTALPSSTKHDPHKNPDKKNNSPILTVAEAKRRRDKADDMGLEMLTKKLVVMTDDPASDIDGCVLDPFNFAYSTYDIYYWSTKENDWAPYDNPYGGFALWDEANEVFVHDSLLCYPDEDDGCTAGFYYTEEVYDSDKVDESR